MTLTEEEVSNIFETDIQELITTPEDDCEFIKQNHFGDLLIEKVTDGTELWKLWRNLDCNDYTIEVEYHGRLNNYRWETVLVIDLP